MFNQSKSLENPNDIFYDISNWNTNNAINMSHMFSGYKSMLDISNWNTSNVINMSYMFS